MLGIAPLGALPYGGFPAPTGNAYTLTAAVGAYTLAGIGPTLRAGRRVNAYTELVTNPTFNTDTSGWTLAGTDTTFTSANGMGVLALGPGANSSYVYQSIPVTIGKTYRLQVTTGPGTGALAEFMVGSRPGDVYFAEASSGGTGTIDFQAVFSPLYISLKPYGATNNCTVRFDTVSLQEAGNYLLSLSNVTITRGRQLRVTPGVYYAATPNVSLRITRQFSLGAGIYALSGTALAVTAGHKLTVTSATYALSTNPVTITAQRRVTAAPGVYNLSGSSALLMRRYIMPLGGSAYSLAGTNVSVLNGHLVLARSGSYQINGGALASNYHTINKIISDGASYAVTGGAMTFTYAHRLAAAPGTYLTQGHAPSLVVARKLALAAGVYSSVGQSTTFITGLLAIGIDIGAYINSLRGTPVTLIVSRKLALGANVFNLTGIAVGLSSTRMLAATAGVYMVAGTDPGIAAQRKVSAIPGVYAVIGSTPRLLRQYQLSASGSYIVSGASVQLRAARNLQLSSNAFLITWSSQAPVYQRLTASGPRALSANVSGPRYAYVPAQSRYAAVEPQQRYAAVAPLPPRYAAVEPVASRDIAEPPLVRTT